MWAVVKEQPGPGAVHQNRPIPNPGPGEVRIAVRVASICGTDVHVFKWNRWAEGRVKPPLVLGHECAGVIEAVGPGVVRPAIGDRVALESHITCGRCASCRGGQAHACQRVAILGVDRDGVFAERIVAPAQNCWPLPPSLPWQFSSLLEPFGNAVHTALSVPLTGRNVLITGAGFTGLAATGVTRAAGAAKVVVLEPAVARRQLAQSMGATIALDPTDPDLNGELRAIFGEDGADVALEMSGNESALLACLKTVRAGGEVALLGLPDHPVSLPLSDLVILRGLTLHGITGRKIWQTWQIGSALLAERRVDLGPLVTSRLSFSEWQDGFAHAAAREGKVVLTAS